MQMNGARLTASCLPDRLPATKFKALNKQQMELDGTLLLMLINIPVTCAQSPITEPCAHAGADDMHPSTFFCGFTPEGAAATEWSEPTRALSTRVATDVDARSSHVECTLPLSLMNGSSPLSNVAVSLKHYAPTADTHTFDQDAIDVPFQGLVGGDRVNISATRPPSSPPSSPPTLPPSAPPAAPATSCTAATAANPPGTTGPTVHTLFIDQGSGLSPQTMVCEGEWALVAAVHSVTPVGDLRSSSAYGTAAAGITNEFKLDDAQINALLTTEIRVTMGAYQAPCSDSESCISGPMYWPASCNYASNTHATGNCATLSLTSGGPYSMNAGVASHRNGLVACCSSEDPSVTGYWANNDDNHASFLSGDEALMKSQFLWVR